MEGSEDCSVQGVEKRQPEIVGAKPEDLETDSGGKEHSKIRSLLENAVDAKQPVSHFHRVTESMSPRAPRTVEYRTAGKILETATISLAEDCVSGGKSGRPIKRRRDG